VIKIPINVDIFVTNIIFDDFNSCVVIKTNTIDTVC